ncbi:MAG TPA: LptA/OstA family protein, partial [Deinococcales bacterium]|nr:LptA/OstA family protein [Deinococcales bacterium]
MPARRLVRPHLLALLAGVAVTAGAQTGGVDTSRPAEEYPTTITVHRKDKTITAMRYGPNDAGLAVICAPPEDDPNAPTRSVLYDAPPYKVHVTISDDTILAPIATVLKQPNGDGHLEAFSGTVQEAPDNPDACVLPAATPDSAAGSVQVLQGKTSLTGSHLTYDESDGLAVIAGPITFSRPQTGADGSSDTLSGTSDRITINVDKSQTTLDGNVTLASKCRTSKAARVLYDDKRSLAVLYGSPATSVETNGNKVQGSELTYNLESNDISINGQVTGSLNDTDSCSAPGTG